MRYRLHLRNPGAFSTERDTRGVQHVIKTLPDVAGRVGSRAKRNVALLHALGDATCNNLGRSQVGSANSHPVGGSHLGISGPVRAHAREPDMP